MAVNTVIQVRRDTAANWTTTNPTLASGEIGFETDTSKFKIGTGSTAWTSLGYAPVGLLKRTVHNTAGSALVNYSTSLATLGGIPRFVHVTLQGSGAGGAGSGTTGAGQLAIGGGGGGGAYMDVWYPWSDLSTMTNYDVQVGVAGTAGVVGGAGGNGNASVWIGRNSGGTAITGANLSMAGGTGGTIGAAYTAPGTGNAGGAGGAVGTVTVTANATYVAYPGGRGGRGFSPFSSVGFVEAQGGSSYMSNAYSAPYINLAASAGAAGVGYGQGGGGGTTGFNTTGSAGGAGSQGVVIVEFWG